MCLEDVVDVMVVVEKKMVTEVMEDDEVVVVVDKKRGDNVGNGESGDAVGRIVDACGAVVGGK